ncbi:MAG: hypothetical protein IKA71_04370 [Lentisphaeria bacterium]|nr:hypothetical protein [Lentisphaeria bacterium]
MKKFLLTVLSGAGIVFSLIAGDNLLTSQPRRIAASGKVEMIPMAKAGKGRSEKGTLREVTAVPEDEKNANLLAGKNIRWGSRVRKGAKGKVTVNPDRSLTLNRKNPAGEVLIVNDSPIVIEERKSYQVKMVLDAASDVNGALVLQMPGGNRRPFPSVRRDLPSGESEIYYRFTAGPGEKNLKIHFYLRTPGTVKVKKIELTEIPAAQVQSGPLCLNTLNCNGAMLKRHFSVVHNIRKYDSPFPDAEVRAFSGGFHCPSVNVPTAGIKMIEVEFRAFRQGGALRLDFSVESDGRIFKSFQTASVVPDGEFYTLRFPVADDPVWKGTLKELKLSWQSLREPGRISFRSMRAYNDANVIVDAWKVLLKGSVKADFFRPRGIYRFSRRGEGASAQFTLTFFDRLGKEIAREVLPAGEKEKIFTAPEKMVTAKISADNIAGAANVSRLFRVPLVELIEMPVLDKSVLEWRGKWIWSRSGEGPMHTNVYFARDIELPDEVAEAFFAGTGDDSMTLNINGKSQLVTREWHAPKRLDITGMLKKGKNTVVLDVFNFGAWGGALADIYIRCKNGREFYITTDESWFCREGGNGAIDRKVHVIGPVPAMPWGSRLAFCYAGARGRLELTPAGDMCWDAKVKALPVADTDKFDFLVDMPDGTQVSTVGTITPGSGKWKVGETLRLHVKLPDLRCEKAGIATAKISSPLLDAAGKGLEFPVQVREKSPLSTMAITGAGSRPYFVINGKKSFPFYFVLPTSFIMQPERMEYLLRNARNSGCEVVRLTFGLRHASTAKSVFDFSQLDRSLRVIAGNDPDMKVILATPCYMPEWFLKEYPGEATAFFGGVKRNRQDDFQSIASRKWLEVMADYFAELKKYLENSPHAGRVVGINPTDGTTSEWLWSHGRGHGKRVYSGWSEAGVKAYREYLRRIYGNDPAKLAAAWRRNVNFDNVLPPEPSRIDNSSVGDMLDPARDKDIIDWSDFRNECLSDAFIELCGMGKQVGDGKWIAGSYYGYLSMLSWMHNYLQDSGHMRITKVARSPKVDYVLGPTLYHWRTLGNGDGLMQPAESFSANGTLVIAELDMRTFTEPNEYEARNGRASTVEHSVSMLDRVFGMLLARGCGGHWLEMYDRWFREPVIIDQLRSFRDLYMSLPEKASGTVPREVTVVSDQYSTAYVKTNNSGGIHVLLIAEFMRRMPETAVSFNHVLKEDLLVPGKIPPQKLYIITNVFTLSASERRAMLARFEREKATVLWLYAPGVFYPDCGPSAQFASELLGIKLGMDMRRSGMTVDFLDPEKWGVRQAFCNSVFTPYFFAESGFDEVIAKSSDGKPAVVRWQRNGVTNYFSTIPSVPAGFIRKIAASSGVRVWSRTDDPVWAGNDFVTLHARTGGEKQLDLPAGTAARSVLGPELGVLADGKFTAEPGRTYGFVIEKR